jgi:DUF4097 and DUF4098 domain-containing protein YvlB
VQIGLMVRMKTRATIIAIVVLAGGAWAARPARRAVSWQNELPLPPGTKLAISNDSGPISVTGWDKDTVQAGIGGEVRDLAAVRIYQQPGKSGVMTISVDPQHRHSDEPHLIVKVPQAVAIDSLHSGSGDIDITGVKGSISANTGSGVMKISNVGPITAQTGSGDISADSIAGDASLQTASGDIRATRISGRASLFTGSGDVRIEGAGSLSVKNASGSVRAKSIDGSASIQANSADVDIRGVKGDLIAKIQSGDLVADNIGGFVEAGVTSGDVSITHSSGDVKISTISADVKVQCATGSVRVDSASSSIELAGIAGDVEAKTASGDVTFTGSVRPHGHYFLKSVSGSVRMAIQADIPGFTASLQSYSGEMETAFPLRLESPMGNGKLPRKVIGRYGDGQANISLDSFSGTVTLTKLVGARMPKC